MTNLRQWKQEVMTGNKRYAIPIMTNPGIELLNAKVIDAVKNGEVHFEAIKKLNERYPADAITSIMDLTLEAEAFGAEIIYPEDEIPSIKGRLVNDAESVKALQIPSLKKGRVQEYLKANHLTVDYIKDKPIFAGCIGPFSLAGRLYGMTEMMIAIYTEPETINLLLTKCMEFITAYCTEIKETGVSGVIMAEPAAGLITNEDCSIFSSKFIKPLISKLQDDSFMFVLHNCGNNGHCTEAMLETEAMAYHFGNKIDMVKALEQCSNNVLVMGNLDPSGIFKMSSSKEVHKVTTDLLQITKRHKNFVISSGCDIPPHVSFGNIEAFYTAIQNFNNE